MESQEGGSVGGRAGQQRTGRGVRPGGRGGSRMERNDCGVSEERIRKSAGDSVWETACGRGGSVRRGFGCVRSRPDDHRISLSIGITGSHGDLMDYHSSRSLIPGQIYFEE